MRREGISPAGIYLITDRRLSGREPAEMVLPALEAGIRWVQYRDKDVSRCVAYHEARKLRRLTAEFGAFFIVNDYADIALAVDADGVHLGQDDLPLDLARKVMGARIIGISTHSVEQARAAEAGGADYVGFGPLFPTSTKDAGDPKGLSALTAVRAAVSVPVVAIGGISTHTLPRVLEAGADAAAVASAVFGGDIRTNCRSLLRIAAQRSDA